MQTAEQKPPFYLGWMKILASLHQFNILL